MTAIAPASGSLTSAATNTQANSALSNLSGNFDTFINLLTAQLQYQDPLEPTDVSEFTQQLVQYSQVEQQIGTNAKLDDVIASLSVQGGNAYLNYIGRTVDADTSSLLLKNGAAEVGYTLTDVATTAKVEVYNSAGALVKTIDGGKTVGRHTVQWDGTHENGNQLADGVYTFKLVAENADGKAIDKYKPFMVTKVQGVVSGGADGALLDLGNGLTINPAQVYAVRDAGA